MSPARLAAAVNARLHLPHRRRHRPAAWCEYGRHVYPRAYVDRDRTGVFLCPGCGEHISVQSLMDGRYRIVPHIRHSSVETVAVMVVDTP